MLDAEGAASCNLVLVVHCGLPHDGRIHPLKGGSFLGFLLRFLFTFACLTTVSEGGQAAVKTVKL